MSDYMDINNENLTDDQQNQILFMMLVQQNQQIAMMGMGKLKNPATDKIERDLNSAKYAIDTLKMLEKYTEGNLPGEMKNYLRETLNNLRLNYADETSKKEEQEGEQAESQDSGQEQKKASGESGDDESKES